MKKMLLFGLLTILALVAYGCQTVQTIPKPIEQTPVQNQTLISSSPCSPSETFIPDFLDGYECQPTSVIKACEAAGGNWRMFGNGCGDSCGEKPRICTLAFQPACDCGVSKCFGTPPPCRVDSLGNRVCDATLEVKLPTCKDDPYEPYTTPKEACEATGGRQIILSAMPPVPVYCCGSFNEIGGGSTTYFWSSLSNCGFGEGVSCTGSCPSEKSADYCNKFATQFCGGIANIKCLPGLTCVYDSTAPTHPDEGGICKKTIVQPLQKSECKCPLGTTFGLQGCKEYPTRTNELMSIVGGWQ